MSEAGLIKSISYDQNEILSWILKLYVPKGRFALDPTFSKGGFYQTIPLPEHCYDLHPQKIHVQQADCRNLPLPDGSVDSMMLDLPFLATTGPSLEKECGNVINKRFSVCKNEKELSLLYQDALKEAYRVLSPRGILVMKCQDKVSSGKQYMMHCMIYQWALETGFKVLDLFILLAKNRLVADWQRNQKHARKYHSYFYVFVKE